MLETAKWIMEEMNKKEMLTNALRLGRKHSHQVTCSATNMHHQHVQYSSGYFCLARPISSGNVVPWTLFPNLTDGESSPGKVPCCNYVPASVFLVFPGAGPNSPSILTRNLVCPCQINWTKFPVTVLQ